MQKYKIPKNLCQSCYEVGGRYIMDCYCIVCEQCYLKFPSRGPNCGFCGKPSRGNKIDAKNQGSIRKISHLFDNVDTGLAKLLEISKFQTEIANRYCQHLEKQISIYQSAINELISYNPSLQGYFADRIKIKRGNQTQKIDRNASSTLSVKDSTVKPMRQYASEICESRRTANEMLKKQSDLGQGVRPIGGQRQNLSGNAVYKVPNLNFNTAIRSSKRSNYPEKMAPNYEQQYEHFRRRRQ